MFPMKNNMEKSRLPPFYCCLQWTRTAVVYFMRYFIYNCGLRKETSNKLDEKKLLRVIKDFSSTAGELETAMQRLL